MRSIPEIDDVYMWQKTSHYDNQQVRNIVLSLISLSTRAYAEHTGKMNDLLIK